MSECLLGKACLPDTGFPTQEQRARHGSLGGMERAVDRSQLTGPPHKTGAHRCGWRNRRGLRPNTAARCGPRLPFSLERARLGRA